MVKKKRDTKRQQYAAILEAKKINIADCVVISFSFPCEPNAVSFHFDFMAAKMDCLIFDRIKERTTIILRNNAELDNIRSLSHKYNASENNANLMQEIEI